MTETVDRSSPAVLRSLEDLAEFHASSGHFEVVVDLEKDTGWIPSWVSGERVLFVGVGTIDSVVSFEGLDESRILVSDDRKSVTIRLPAPQLEEPRIDLDQSYLYARERGVLDRVGGLFGGQSVDWSTAASSWPSSSALGPDDEWQAGADGMERVEVKEQALESRGSQEGPKRRRGSLQGRTALANSRGLQQELADRRQPHRGIDAC